MEIKAATHYSTRSDSHSPGTRLAPCSLSKTTHGQLGVTERDRLVAAGCARPTLRILMLLPKVPKPTEVYAIENRTEQFMARLRGAGYVVLFVTPRGIYLAGNERHQRADTGRPQVKRIENDSHQTLGPLDALRIFMRLSIFRRHSRSRGADILFFYPGWIPAAAAFYKLLSPAVFLHFDVPGLPHEESRIARYRFWRLKARIFARIFHSAVAKADVITTINGPHAAYIRSHYHRVASLAPDLPDGDWLEGLLNTPPEPRTQQTTVLYVGSLFRSRIDLFLRVMKDIQANRSDIRTIIAGDGADLQRYRNQYGSGRTEFVGYEGHEQLINRIREAGICYSDVWSRVGTPAKVIEYMAAGRSVVTHDTPSTRELITDGVNGVFAPETAAGLQHTLEKLLDDPDARRKLGASARERIREIMTIDWTAPMIDAYHRLSHQPDVVPADV